MLDRRRKVEAWQAQKRSMEEKQQKEDDDVAEGKGWTLDSDGSDDDEKEQPAVRFRSVAHDAFCTSPS